MRANDTAGFTTAALKQEGFRPLAMNILDYVLQGITTLEEMFRIAGEVSELIKNTNQESGREDRVS